MRVTIGVLPPLAYSYGKGDGTRLRAALRAAALTVGVIVLTAQLVAMIANGFTGLITSLFQATGTSVPSIVLSMAQGVVMWLANRPSIARGRAEGSVERAEQVLEGAET